MNIGLIDIEPKIFNTAYMQIASYHKSRGDSVEWWTPLADRKFDKIYCSSIFDFTDKSEVPARAVCGGTGFDLSSRLAEEIESGELDYSIYPKCKTSFIWFSRGCIRNCPWCVVPKKEGRIKPVLPLNINPSGEYITVMDNNFFASPNWKESIVLLEASEQPCDFQGIDIRTLNDEKVEFLKLIRFYKQVKIAWDDPHLDMTMHLRWLVRRVPAYKLMCYVLIGFNSTEEQDLYRVNILKDIGIDPFVMPYDRRDLYQKTFARWVNHKAIFKKVSWRDYKRRVSQQEDAGNGWKR